MIDSSWNFSREHDDRRSSRTRKGEVHGEAIRIEAAAKQGHFQAGLQPACEWRENQKATLLACQLAWPFRAAVGGFARVQLIASILAPTSRGPRSYLSFDRTADVSIEVETKCPSRA
jgi:hypothetical protein